MHSAKTYDGKIAGLYDLEETLGRGHFAVVKLARHVFTGEKVAVKVIDKTKLDDVSKAHLFQEVRCMKLVQHPNVVRLYEVIDTQTKLYLILELGDGGDLYDYIMKHETGLGEEMAQEYFRQIVRAISYCHQLHVVHRDLKPENVVFFEKLGVVKLTDFGFSNKFCPGQKLETSCGSLAYSAPEILLGDSYDAPAVDVWSLGVILYMLVVGQAPFQEANDNETLTMIMDCKYTIPSHVSSACRELIARMLVREPEMRASLSDIASDPWLGGRAQVEYLPLVSRHQVTEEDHNIIITKMVNGNIASKEEILEALDKNEYNHITATYFLLAERKLKSHRQEQAQNRTKQNQILLSLNNASSKNSTKSGAESPGGAGKPPSSAETPSALSVPRNPGDSPQAGRVRKCSIVQEEDDDDEEEEYCGVGSAGQELMPPHSSLNRRGSRSEGKLNVAVQERIAEERRKEKDAKVNPLSPVMAAKDDATCWTPKHSAATGIHNAYIPSAGKWRMGAGRAGCVEARLQQLEAKRVVPAGRTASYQVKPKESETERHTSHSSHGSSSHGDIVTLADSATITIPLNTSSPAPPPPQQQKFKTMPSPTRIALNEINEEGVAEFHASAAGDSNLDKRARIAINYEQRRSKFHKTRTASCSSSDASDDDSESRKKRAHKISTERNSQRRDSHDDSSDSQDPGGNGGAGGNPPSALGDGGSGEGGSRTTQQRPDSSNGEQHSSGNNNSGDSSSRNQRQCNGDNFRRNRRRTGETRLRESQSLNRITEVQESEVHGQTNADMFHERLKKSESEKHYSHNTVLSEAAEKKSLGARLMHSWQKKHGGHTLSKRKYLTDGAARESKSAVIAPVSRTLPKNLSEEKENAKVVVEKYGKRVKLLGRYFQVSKKLCIPLPSLISKGRLYKARSCGSITRDRVTSPMEPAPNGLVKSSLTPNCVHADRAAEESLSKPAKSGKGKPKPARPESNNGNLADINKNVDYHDVS